MISWKELALEYRKEIEALLGCIDDACIELEKKVPNSYTKGLNILEKGIDLSTENVRLLSCSEPVDEFQTKIEKANVKREEEKDDDWLFN